MKKQKVFDYSKVKVNAFKAMQYIDELHDECIENLLNESGGVKKALIVQRVLNKIRAKIKNGELE